MLGQFRLQVVGGWEPSRVSSQSDKLQRCHGNMGKASGGGQLGGRVRALQRPELGLSHGRGRVHTVATMTAMPLTAAPPSRAHLVTGRALSPHREQLLLPDPQPQVASPLSPHLTDEETEAQKREGAACGHMAEISAGQV